MPLTALGRRLLDEFKKEYGDGRGERVFYAKVNADPAFKKKVEPKKEKP